MTRPLLVGVQLPEVEWEVPFPELIRMAQSAEAVGFDSVWLGDHLLYDLIYNPEKTLFLKKGAEHGAATKNGYEMLLLQAEKSWEIWNSKGKNP